MKLYDSFINNILVNRVAVYCSEVYTKLTDLIGIVAVYSYAAVCHCSSSAESVILFPCSPVGYIAAFTCRNTYRLPGFVIYLLVIYIGECRFINNLVICLDIIAVSVKYGVAVFICHIIQLHCELIIVVIAPAVYLAVRCEGKYAVCCG